jgi:hypothetical protein
MFLFSLFVIQDPSFRVPGILGYFSAFLSFAAAPLYVIARVTLLILALISVRQLPTGVYRTVRWTNFVPHI